jgi:hypothetical protein
MDLERLVEVGPALLVLMMGLVALWAWKGKFGASKDAAEVNPLVKAMQPLFLFAAACFFVVAVIYIFQQ